MQKINSSSLSATKKLLELLGKRFDKQILKEDLLSHPDYPSLHALHCTLSKYGIDSEAIEVDIDYLGELPQPFLAYINLPSGDSDFIVVNEVKGDDVEYFSVNGKKKTQNKCDFKNGWTKIALIIKTVDKSPNSESEKIEAQETYKVVYIISLIIICLSLAGWAAQQALISFFFLVWATLKMIGIIISIPLIKYEIDQNSETVNRLCSGREDANCDKVLRSSGAKIGALSWSEIGFSYFTGSLIYLLVTGNASNYFPLALLSILAVSFSFFSIYYQYVIVKQWCKICIAVQFVILLEALIVLIGRLCEGKHIYIISKSLPSVLLLIALLCLPLMIWLLLKPQLKKGEHLETFKYAYKRLLNNPEIFDLLLKQQNKALNGYDRYSLLLGSSAARIEIIEFSDPYCKPCAEVHLTLEKILEVNTDVKLRVIFRSSDDEDDLRGIVSKHFISYYLSYGKKALQEVMHYWYTEHNITLDNLFDKYPVAKHSECDKIKEGMNYWQKEMLLTVSPVIFVDGYLLPDEYTLSELYMLMTIRN